MIDSHCHLDTDAFATDRDAMITRALAAGVRGMLVPAIWPRSWPELLALPTQHPPIAIALGIHPQVVPELSSDEHAIVATLTRTIADLRSPDVVAIGECGLDGGTADRDAQIQIFRAQIRSARELKLPLIVHVVRTHDLVPAILAEERAHEVGGVLHSYSGPPDLIPRYRDLNFSFSFAGPVTWPGARRPIAAACAVPDELLLVETDSPDQSPTGHRGERNEPANLLDVVHALARIRGTDTATIIRVTTENARRRFGDRLGQSQA